MRTQQEECSIMCGPKHTEAFEEIQKTDHQCTQIQYYDPYKPIYLTNWCKQLSFKLLASKRLQVHQKYILHLSFHSCLNHEENSCFFYFAKWSSFRQTKTHWKMILSRVWYMPHQNSSTYWWGPCHWLSCEVHQRVIRSASRLFVKIR